MLLVQPSSPTSALIMHATHHALTLLSACLLLTSAASPGAVIFSDDFSSPAAGNPPAAGKWTRSGSGSVLIRNQSIHAGFGNPEQFLRLSGTSIACVANAAIPLSGVVTAHLDFYEPSNLHHPGERFIFGFGRNNELNTANAGLAFRLQDGTVSGTSGTSGPAATYALNRAHAATVIFNRRASAVTYPFAGAWHSLPAGRADLWLEDWVTQEVRKIGTYTASANGPDANQFLFRVFSTSPGNTVDIDNVFIHNTMQLPDWSGTWRSQFFEHYWQPPGNSSSFDFHANAFLQDFSYAGYRLRAAGFPSTNPATTSLPLFDVSQPPYSADNTGTTDVTTQIQNAINDAGAAGGGLVYLPAGIYRVSPQGANTYALRLNQSNVVLRGASASTTFVYNAANSMRAKHVIRVEGPSAVGHLHAGTGSTTLTANLVGPATVIPVANPALFSAGSWVTLRSDATDAWINEHGETGWLGHGGTLGGLAYRRQVTAVNTGAGTITIDVPTRYAMKTRDNARVVLNSAGSAFGLTRCGVEYLSIGMAQRSGTSGWGENDYTVDNTNAWHAHGSFAIMLTRARDCWVRNVNSYQPAGNSSGAHLLSNGVGTSDSSRLTLQNCHFQRPQYGGGGGNGYMFRLSNTAETLVRDCQATLNRHGFVLASMRSTGNVFLRCTDTDTGKQIGGGGTPQNTSGSGSDHHMHFSHCNLVDACTAHNSYFTAHYRPHGSDPKHNLTAAHSVFWNTNGQGSSWGAVVRTEQSRYGYAIGTRGTRTTIDRPTGGGSKMSPPDIVEGAGQGGSLSPFSLYEEQLARRQLP